MATAAGASDLDHPSVLENQSLHVVCVVDPVTGFQGIYTNGVLEAATYNSRVPLNTIAADYSFVGRSLFSADGYLNASIDELRIYEGRLTSAPVAANYQAGPENEERPRLTVQVEGGNALLTWPVAIAGFTLQTSPALGPNAQWTAVGTAPVTEGGLLKVTAPLTGTAFYRLRK
jgi:hypothetical protein